jgi:hypothetical protein
VGYYQDVHSLDDDASDFSNVLRNLIASRLDLEYTTVYKKKKINFPTRLNNFFFLTLPGQSWHLIRHSGVLVALTFRKVTSNLSIGYLALMACMAPDNHWGS